LNLLNLMSLFFLFRMGAHYRVSGSVGTEQNIPVAQIITHPNYHKPLRYSNDIAVLRLSKPAVLGKGVATVCLPRNELPLPLDDPGKKCYITGWGTLASGGSQPNNLMQASVPLVSKSRCLKGYPGQIHDSMLCAGLDQGGVDACQGDSGGPLVCEFNGRWYLEGATSWGHGCAAPNKYGVYALVRHNKAWVKQVMGV
jgi:trypsin